MVSYSGIRGHGSGKSTLPSVDAWGTTMNIVKDPPKGITTRRINKISDTSSLTEMIDESHDRACEAINVYARGVNPMVSVSYSGNGNAGLRGNTTATSSGKQAYLPYRVMKDGAFVPPSFSQLNLLPLSRLPRLVTSVYTQPGYTDFSKKLTSPQEADKTREVKNSLLKVCSNPTATYNIGGTYSAKETYEIKNVIQNPLLISADSGIRTRDITKQIVKTPTKEINNSVLSSESGEGNTVNIGSNLIVKYSPTVKLNTTKYIHEDILQGNIPTNLFRNIEGKPLNEIGGIININKYTHDDTLRGNIPTNISRNIESKKIDETAAGLIDNNRYIQNVHNINYDTIKTGVDKNEYIHIDVKQDRNMPVYQVSTNKSDNTVYKNIEPIHSYNLKRKTPIITIDNTPTVYVKRGLDNTNREYKLPSKINIGGFEGKPKLIK